MASGVAIFMSTLALKIFALRWEKFPKISMKFPQYPESINRTSVTLHAEMTSHVTSAPMSFFDTTPLGRIINRFSKDMFSIDMVLPGVTDGMIWYIFEVCQVLFVVTYMTPILSFALLPLGELYNFF